MRTIEKFSLIRDHFVFVGTDQFSNYSEFIEINAFISKRDTYIDRLLIENCSMFIPRWHGDSYDRNN